MRAARPRVALPGCVRRRLARLAGDEGFSIIEIIVAFSILLTVSASVALLLGDHLRLSVNNRGRVTATHLAESQINFYRNTDLANPTLGRTTTSSVIDNVTYTVNTDVQWVDLGTATPACGAAGSTTDVRSLRADVSVSWPNARKPVVLNSLITPKTASTASGSVWVKVKLKNGAAASGVEVTLAFPDSSFRKQVTAADGCANFTSLPVATGGSSYTASLFKAGSTDLGGSTRPSQGLTLTTSSKNKNWTATYGP